MERRALEHAIAVVGMACRYPDARSPEQLWENVLAQRRAFRRLPPERLRLEDYYSADRNAPDTIYATNAAVIEGYTFDRARFRIAGGTFRAVDLAHWLALDVAAQALADAGFEAGEGLPRETTGVLVGNTLTGEFSRANALRLRWPYVRRVVNAALGEQSWSREQRRAFLHSLEARYKAPFPEVGEETLAGGLSNTIAGRVCNHFDLKGGGYTVDGACAASLLAVTTACSSLVAGDLDVALAGGVDLSLDPFELVGFARVGALAPEEMRVYDARSSGFWPGEGCGFVVLMRAGDAIAQGRRLYALVRGWGVSSDGSGGITRPEAEGQRLALERAYRRAGFGPDTVAYFEGHGTGTSVGDAVELQVLSRARREASPAVTSAAVGSIKANIGHTKAAAGVAGFIKAVMAVHHQVLPPTTGCVEPHAVLSSREAAVRVLAEAEPWPADQPLRAAVSAMGFGGIDTHVVLEAGAAGRRSAAGADLPGLSSTPQDAELFLFAAPDREALRLEVERVRAYAARISLAELADLAAALAGRLADASAGSESDAGARAVGPTSSSPMASGSAARAAVVASTPAELASRLGLLAAWLLERVPSRLDIQRGVFLGADPATGGAARPPRIGYLFPGQGSPSHAGGGVWRRRFGFARALYARAPLPAGRDPRSTDLAQPAIVTASLAGLRALDALGVAGCAAVGHSLGELTALHWAGALDEDAVVRVAAARGRAMAELGSPTGAMLSLAFDARETEALIAGTPLIVAGLNTPRQTVVSGESGAIERLAEQAHARGVAARRLPVSHAFHSPLVAAAAPALAAHLAGERVGHLKGRIFSTITGAALEAGEDPRALLVRQVTSPVRFTEALAAAAPEVDLWVEVGPGQVLSAMAGENTDAPAIALDAGGPSLGGLLRAAGALHVLGAPLRHAALFEGRFTRPFDLDWQPRFFVNPCELAPLPEEEDAAEETRRGRAVPAPSGAEVPGAAHEPSTPAGDRDADRAPQPTAAVEPAVASDSALEMVRRLVAERAELPVASVGDHDRLLGDLHLNSIVVGQLAAEAAKRLGLPAPADPTAYAGATVAELAGALEALAGTRGSRAQEQSPRAPAGVDSWVRAFSIRMVEKPLPKRPRPSGSGAWKVLAPPGDALAPALEQAFARSGAGEGVVVCLPWVADERHASLLIEGARAIWPRRGTSRFVVVERGGGGGAFARSLHLESPETTTCVVEVPAGDPRAPSWVVAEALGALGYGEAHYDSDGTRREPQMAPLADEPADNVAPPGSQEAPLGSRDVLLVTGGGKGIAAECALALARASGVRLALLGRARPEADRALADNLERLGAAGVTFRYVSADVTDVSALRLGITEAERALGPITAVLHGAGANQPQPLSALDDAAFQRTLAPKLAGARHLLEVLDLARLKLFVSFGSIIARTGMRGEADYAVANEWLRHLVERLQARQPGCRCLAVEWSLWSGVGMAEQLGRVDALVREGVTPITPELGVEWLQQLIGRPQPDVAVIVTGRFGEPPTLALDRPELPLTRFLERPRAHYPGIELVVDAELSTVADPYLDDHRFHGERLFPAVMGLEAMAQAAMALARSTAPPVFERVEFTRPVVVPGEGTETIRVAALQREPGCVDVALRSSSTSFQVDHFSARCRFGAREADGAALEPPVGADGPLPIDPEQDLYGSILFQSGRFKRVRGYRWLRAQECLAEIAGDGSSGASHGFTDASHGSTEWFGPYLPAGLVLGDPGRRDAAIHAVQACIPHAALLPVAVERIELAPRSSGAAGDVAPQTPGATSEPGPLRLVHARERRQEGDLHVYDLEVADAAGKVCERWSGLALRAVGPTQPRGPWAPPLLAAYVERRLWDFLPGASVGVTVERTGELDRRARSERAILHALGRAAPLARRPDGKPEFAGRPDLAISVAHADVVTVAIAGAGALACDIEPVTARTASEWADLLGSERHALARLMARESGEDDDTACTRVWTAQECLKKAGVMLDSPLVLAGTDADGWALLAAGPLRLATYVAAVCPCERRMAFAVLAGSDHARV